MRVVIRLTAIFFLLAASVGANERILRGRVVSEGETGVAKADVGTRWVAGDDYQGPDDWRLTDAGGQFELVATQREEEPIPVMARDAAGTRIGMVLVEPDEIEQPITISLQPAVTLQGHANYSDVARRPSRLHVEVGVLPESFPELPVEIGTLENFSRETLAAIDDAAVRLFDVTSRTAEFSLRLPAGRYWLRCYAADVEDAYRLVTLKPGQRERQLGPLEMPLKPQAKLYGKPAPEWNITEVRGLDAAARLSDLRGKWVLLEFWGHWCDPCVTRSLPRLADFYRKRLEDRDRFEIVAVHFKDADTLEDLEEKLAPIQEKYWGGQPLPFPVIVDATEKTVNAYGIDSFPTTILVDPEGKVSRVRSATELAAILDGTLIPGENRAVDVPTERPDPWSPTLLAANWIKSDDYISCKGHTQYVTGVSFAPKGDFFVTAGADTRLIVWDTDSGAQKRTHQLAKGIHFASQGVPAEVLRDGESVLSVSYQKRETRFFRTVASYRIESLGTDEAVGLSPPPLARWRSSPASSLSIDKLAVSANGSLLVMSQWDESQKVDLVTGWDLATGKQRVRWEGGHAMSIAVSPDGRSLAVGEGGHTERATQVRVLDTQIGETDWKQEQAGWGVAGLAFSADGTRLASVAWDESIVIRDTGDGSILQTLRQPGHQATAVAFSPDGRWLATGGTWPFRSVCLWDLNADTLRANLFGHHGEAVRDVAFSPDGQKLVSVGGSMDGGVAPDTSVGQVYLWNLNRLLSE